MINETSNLGNCFTNCAAPSIFTGKVLCFMYVSICGCRKDKASDLSKTLCCDRIDRLGKTVCSLHGLPEWDVRDYRALERTPVPAGHSWRQESCWSVVSFFFGSHISQPM